MEPNDLEQTIREEMRFTGLSADAFQQRSTAGMPDLGPVHEIGQAIDDACRHDPRSTYDLPMEPQYLFDPQYGPDPLVLILDLSLPGPF